MGQKVRKGTKYANKTIKELTTLSHEMPLPCRNYTEIFQLACIGGMVCEKW